MSRIDLGAWRPFSILRVALVAGLVPLVILTTARAAEAGSTNDNVWHSADYHLTKQAAFDIDCHNFATRYNADGTGVVWADTECADTTKTGLWEVSPPSAGTEWEVTWSGQRTGATGSGFGAGAYGAWKGSTNGACWVNGKLDLPVYSSGDCNFKLKVGETAVAESWLIVYRSPTNANHTWTYAYAGQRKAAQTAYNIPAGTFVEVCNGYVGTDTNAPTYGCGSAGTLGWVYFATYGGAAGGTSPNTTEAGQGAGEPCEAVASGVTAESSKDQWFYPAGRILAGAASFGASLSGSCQVTEVCITMKQPGNSGLFIGCDAEGWGLPDGAPDPAGVEQPTPETSGPPDLPTADTEQGFWDGMMGGLWALGRALAKGFGMVVDAVEGIVTGIVDGIGALFIPSDGFLGEKVGSVKAGFEDSTPGNYLGAVSGLDVPSVEGGCEGPTVDFSIKGSEQHWTPLKACDGAMANMAGVCKLLLSVSLSLFGGMACIRALGSGFGWNPGVGGAS